MPIRRYNDGLPVDQPISTAPSLAAADLAPDSAGASEVAANAITAAGNEIDAGAVQAGDVAIGGISAANQFASAVVDEAAMGPNSVGSSELKSGIVPVEIDIDCTKPAVVETLGVGIAPPANFTASKVRMRVGTLPTSAGDAFSWNIRNGVSGNMFATAQVFSRTPDVGGFLKTLDTGGTYTSYLTEVTGTGTAALGGLDTLANGDAVYVGFSQLFSGIQIDMDGANVNAQAAVLAAHYWDGSAWQAVGNLVDGTASGGATFAQDGAITFDLASDWRQNAVNSVTLYWIRLTHNGGAPLTAGTAVDNADAIRDSGVYYEFTPDQNLTVSASSELRVHATEADANADKLSVIVEGTYDF